MRPEQAMLDMSLKDAQRCARRLSRLRSTEAHDAALAFVRVLIKLGAKTEEDKP